MKIDPENTSIKKSGENIPYPAAQAEGNQFTHRTATHVHRRWDLGTFNDWAMLAGVCEKCGLNPTDFTQNYGNDTEEFETCLDLMCPRRLPLCRVAIKIKKRDEAQLHGA